MHVERGQRSIVVGARVTNEKRALARSMRRNPTASEFFAWQLLRDRRCLGMKFRRQQVIRGFVVDFYCHELRLAVEIDGPIHAEREHYDEGRDVTLRAADVVTFRIRSDDLSMVRLEQVVRAALRLRSPSPAAGEGAGG